MIIENLIHGKFIERPNRFIVIFEIENGSTEIAHLRDPGRLKELLIPAVKLLIRKALPNPKRKTKYDVIAVLNHNIWVLIIVEYQKFYTTCPIKPGKSGFKLVKYKILIGRIDSTSLINYVLNYNSLLIGILALN